MKRKATRFLALAMSAVLVTSLTACGDGSDENAKDAVTPVEAQPMLSELELEILNPVSYTHLTLPTIRLV